MTLDNRNVFACIASVSAEIAQTGISKDRSNVQQGYKFRGIDDVYNAIAPLLAKHGLVIIPRILTRSVVERATQKGGTLFYVTVEAEFDFVSSHDGSKTTARSFGEAMDSGDKATNKAMSAAYKYTAFQTFCIPTEGDNDADATTHEVKAEPKKAAELPSSWQPHVAPESEAQLAPPAQRSVRSGHGADLIISEAQGKRFWAIAKEAGWAADELGVWLLGKGFKSIKDITRKEYQALCEGVKVGT